MNQQNAVTALRLTIREHLTNDLRRNVAGIDDSASLLEAGAIDSLGVLQLVALIEERYGIKVSDDDLVPENFETIEAIARFVTEKRDA